MKILYSVAVCLISLVANLTAQKENHIWQISGAELNFNSNPISLSVVDNRLDESLIFESVTVSNTQGQLNFYTSGREVYNRNHSPMPNGDKLLGGKNTAQGVAISQSYQDSLRYYIFYLDGRFSAPMGTGKLHYSVLDMSLNDGLGDVVESSKNTLIRDNLTEKMITVQGDCGQNWLIVHERDSDRLNSYPISAAGIEEPIISEAGSVLTRDNWNGEFRINQQGNRLVQTGNFGGLVELFDFDRGSISNPVQLQIEENNQRIYQVSFSPDGRYLYVIENERFEQFPFELYQYDLAASDIQASKVFISFLEKGAAGGAMEIGPDSMIYLVTTKDYISRIQFPNQKGLACGVEEAAFQNPSPFFLITSLQNPLALARPVLTEQSSLLPPEDVLCGDNEILLDLSDLTADSYLWQDGSDKSIYRVNAPGTYWVDVIRGSCILSDTINISASQNDFSLGPDIIICDQDTISISSPVTAQTYKWSTGQIDRTIRVNTAGSYSLEVSTIDGCVSSDTIEITVDTVSVNLGPDQEICPTDSLILNAAISSDTYLWSDGSMGDQLIVRDSGTYWIEIETTQCIASDTIEISIGWCGEESIPVDSTMLPIDSTLTPIDTGVIPDPNEPVTEIRCEVYVPNAISIFPVVNQQNELLRVLSNCDLSYQQLLLYDRWGNLVYCGNASSFSAQALGLNPGVYVAKFKYQFNGEEDEQEKLQSIQVF